MTATAAPPPRPSPSAPRPLAPPTSSPSPAHGARRRLGRRGAGARSPQPAPSSTRSPTTREPHYGISTGFGALATRYIAAERRAQLQRSLIRSHAAGSGPEVEREVVRALMLLRLSTLATGRTGVRAGDRCRPTPRCSTPASRRSCTSTARSAAPATSRRSSHCALAADGRGRGARRRRRRCGPPADALAAAGIAPVELAEKEGLALINGTDGMLGMLRARPARPAPAADAPPTSPRR